MGFILYLLHPISHQILLLLPSEHLFMLTFPSHSLHPSPGSYQFSWPELCSHHSVTLRPHSCFSDLSKAEMWPQNSPASSLRMAPRCPGRKFQTLQLLRKASGIKPLITSSLSFLAAPLTPVDSVCLPPPPVWQLSLSVLCPNQASPPFLNWGPSGASALERAVLYGDCGECSECPGFFYIEHTWNVFRLCLT